MSFIESLARCLDGDKDAREVATAYLRERPSVFARVRRHLVKERGRKLMRRGMSRPAAVKILAEEFHLAPNTIRKQLRDK